MVDLVAGICDHVFVIDTSSVLAAATMEVHWGNVGSFLGGAATVVLAVAAIIGGSAGLQDWRAKQREQKALAEEQAKDVRLNRRRVLVGWSPNGVPVYGVALVTEPDELKRAVEELSAGGLSEYVVLRVSESGSNVDRAYSLRNLVETEGYLSRPPKPGECEALELGRQRLLTVDGSPSSSL